MLPVWIVLTLFILRSDGGLLKATMFLAGATLVRLVQGIAFGLLYEASASSYGEESAGLIGATLLLLVGVFMLITAVKKWAKQEDPDAPPPQWMTMFDGLTPLRAFGMGVLLTVVAVKQWVFTLSAVSIIVAAQLPTATNVALFLGYAVAAQSLLLTPVVITAVAPAWSAQTLDRVQAWLERHNRAIVVTVSLVFGLWFTWRGVTGLLG